MRRYAAHRFGDDVIDFKLEKYLSGMYDNALAHLAHQFTAHGRRLPEGIYNPLLPAQDPGSSSTSSSSRQSQGPLTRMPSVDTAAKLASVRLSKETRSQSRSPSVSGRGDVVLTPAC